MCPETAGLLFQPGDSLWILVTTVLAMANPEAHCLARGWTLLLCPPSALALSNFSLMLLQRSCVSPAYSLWTAAGCVLLVTRSRCPPAGAYPCRVATTPCL
jgi:hypothetical protein